MHSSQSFFIYQLLVKCADVLVIAGMWWLTWDLRFSTDLFPIIYGIPSWEVYRRITLPLCSIFFAVFHLVGAYRSERVEFSFRAANKVLQGTLLGTLVFVSYLYFTELYRFSRVYLAVFFVLGFLALLLERFFLQLGWNFWLRKFLPPSTVLLVGYGELLEFYYQELKNLSRSPIEWLGRLGPKASQNELPQLHYLGEEIQLLDTVRSNHVDEVILSYPSKDPGQYENLLKVLSHELTVVKVVPDFGKFSTFAYQAKQELGIPFLGFNLPLMGGTDRALKRLLDISGSLLFLIVFSPLYFVLSILVKLSSPGPIIFSQRRMGADGQVFSMYKFRTMPVDAEEKTGAVWATESDDRATSIGRFLRRTSLDELPQFWNVLIGDMSLVGPRPERPVFVDQFRDQVPKYMLRHKVKSGITGWAQINGWRGNTSIEERINHDLFYIRNWSLLLDMKILFLTLFRGFVHPNAY